ncbi:MAG: F0F1 ATP synthase subunit A [Lentisphaerae bacterium]|jgi:F-type H+-transporting ATPase subunit a|nr:F0F1 ATP synthase subunit A [Lentisphaerota bacterium]
MNREAIQAGVSHFVEHHAMVHSGTLFGMGIDSFMLLLIPSVLVVLALTIRFLPGGNLFRIAETYVEFIRGNVVYANFGEEKGRKFVPFFCTLFIFIAAANLLGLIPLFSAVTGNISVTAALASIFLFLTLGYSFVRRGMVKTLGAFIPPGLPLALRPFMFVIEVISLFTRAFALAVRLFGNMLAGHIIIYNLLGLILIFGAMAFPAFFAAIFMYFFEIFVSFLQAYIFTLLSAIFMNMIVNPSD